MKKKRTRIYLLFLATNKQDCFDIVSTKKHKGIPIRTYVDLPHTEYDSKGLYMILEHLLEKSLEQLTSNKAIKKLKLKGEYIDQQQGKHEAYLRAGFKLKETRRNKDTIRRVYVKTNPQK